MVPWAEGKISLAELMQKKREESSPHSWLTWRFATGKVMESNPSKGDNLINF